MQLALFHRGDRENVATPAGTIASHPQRFLAKVLRSFGLAAPLLVPCPVAANRRSDQSPTRANRERPGRSFGWFLTAALLFGALQPPSLHAATIASEQFNYSAGAVNGLNGGSGWNTVWYTCGGQTDGSIAGSGMSYSSGNLSLSVAGRYYNSNGGNSGDHRRLPSYYGNSCAQAGSSIWISFLGRRGAFADLNGYAGLSLFDSVSGDGCANAERLFIGKRTGQSVWGIVRSGGSSGNSSTTYDGTTRLMVVRIDFTGSGNNTVRMWISPSLSSVPSDGSAAVTLTAVADLCVDRIRIQSGTSGSGNNATIDVDELRLGTSFDSVISLQAPTVSIAANPGGAICAGTSVTFTATPGNAGANPSYQWKKNGGNVGANQSTYADAGLANGDQITCAVTQDVGTSGITAQSATSSTITMTVNAVPVGGTDSLSTPKNTQAIITANKLKANDTGTGLSVTAVSSPSAHGTISLSGPDGTVTYTPTTGYTGSDSFTYTLSNANGCTVAVTVDVTVGSGTSQGANAVAAFVDEAPIPDQFVARFAGIPGYEYTVEHSAASGGPWTKLSNQTAPTDNSLGFGIGVFEVRENIGGSEAGFYRTVYPAY